MKTQEELNALKDEVETLNEKLAELTDEELKQVTGGKTNVENPDGTITLYKGQCFWDSYSPSYRTYKIPEDYINISRNTWIECPCQWKTTMNEYGYGTVNIAAGAFAGDTFFYQGYNCF